MLLVRSNEYYLNNANSSLFFQAVSSALAASRFPCKRNNVYPDWAWIMYENVIAVDFLFGLVDKLVSGHSAMMYTIFRL